MRNAGKQQLLPVLVAALAAASPSPAFTGPSTATPSTLQAAAASGLVLQSPDVAPGKAIALGHVYGGSGCRGGNISPALSWSHPPAGTRSFAVLMFDPDAPGGGWWHWAVFDIPAGVRRLRAGAGAPASQLLPPGSIQVRNDWGAVGYGGPCPPPGEPHHYHLILYALRVAKLGLDASASAARVASSARANALAEAEIVGLYGR